MNGCRPYISVSGFTEQQGVVKAIAAWQQFVKQRQLADSPYHLVIGVIADRHTLTGKNRENNKPCFAQRETLVKIFNHGAPGVLNMITLDLQGTWPEELSTLLSGLLNWSNQTCRGWTKNLDILQVRGWPERHQLELFLSHHDNCPEIVVLVDEKVLHSFCDDLDHLVDLAREYHEDGLINGLSIEPDLDKKGAVDTTAAELILNGLGLGFPGIPGGIDGGRLDHLNFKTTAERLLNTYPGLSLGIQESLYQADGTLAVENAIKFLDGACSLIQETAASRSQPRNA